MQEDKHRLPLSRFFVMDGHPVYLNKPAVRVGKFTFRHSPGQRWDLVKKGSNEQRYDNAKHDDSEDFPQTLHGFFPEKPVTTASYSMSPAHDLPRGKTSGVITGLSISVAGLHYSGVLIAGHLQPGNQSRFPPG